MAPLSAADLEARFARLPKCELHVHLRGAMPPVLFAELYGKYGAEAVLKRAPPEHLESFLRYPNLQQLLQNQFAAHDALKHLFAFTQFRQFLNTYLFTGYFFRGIGDFARLVRGVLTQLHAQRIVYAEVIVSLPEYVEQGLPLPALLDVLDSEAQSAPLAVRFIADPVRNYGPERTLQLVHELVRLRPRSIAGITIGGNEAAFPPAQFEATFRAAQDAGLRLTAHAGEALGPQSVRDAIDVLGVERLGHGVRAIEDPGLLAELAARNIALEVCPTSNVCLGIYPTLAEHPAPQLHAAGVPLTISTDDPTFFGVSLAQELASFASACGGLQPVRACLQNACNYAFTDAATKAGLATELAAAWDQEFDAASNAPDPASAAPR